MKRAFIHTNLLTGRLMENGRMEVRRSVTVFTEDDRIIRITSDKEDLQGYEVVDLDGRYMMPGLIDLHVHFVPDLITKPKKKGSSSAKPNYEKTKKLLTENPLGVLATNKLLGDVARNTLFSGVTTIRTVGGIADFDAKMRDKIKAGKAVGPRMIVANTAISVPDGHMAGLLAYEAKSPEEARDYVDKIAATNPDLIKLMVTGGVLDASESGEPGVLKMAPELVKAACDRAHELGYTVAAHNESPEGVKVSIANGVDTIEHGARPDEEMIKLFKEKKAALVATLSPALPYVYMDPEETGLGELGQKNGTIVFNGIAECAKTCLKEGIPVGLGTDTGCPYVASYDTYRELEYFVRFCGVTMDYAIHTATYVNASILHMEDEIGTLEEGKKADFLVTEKNPLVDFRTIRDLYMVSAEGRLYKQPKVRRIASIETALEKIRPLWDK